MPKSKALRSTYVGAHEVDVSFACGDTWYDLSLSTTDAETLPITSRDVLIAVADYVEQHNLSGVTTVEADADFAGEADAEEEDEQADDEPGDEDLAPNHKFGKFKPR